MLNIQNLTPEKEITREEINRIYKQAAEGPFSNYLCFTETQNVSFDIIGVLTVGFGIAAAVNMVRRKMAEFVGIS